LYRCGKLCCDAHTQYEIKLNKQAQHDPEHGIWCKVCVSCFMNRKSYLDNEGATRSKTALFLKHRAKSIDRVYLESNRLEKRLEKLAKIHQSADGGGNGDFLSGSGGILSPSSASLLSLDKSDSTSSRDSLGSMLSPRSSFVSNSNSILSMKLKYRGMLIYMERNRMKDNDMVFIIVDGEQSVTKWQEDKSVKTCPYCE
jgi:rabenosyn-5